MTTSSSTASGWLSTVFFTLLTGFFFPVDSSSSTSQSFYFQQINNSKEKKEITINLEDQKIEKGDNRPFDFDVEPFRKECLINGYDDIALSLKKTSDVESYLEKKKKDTPWLFSA